LKTLKYIIAALSLTLCVNALAETRYVSDNIFIYMRSGPSLKYRITGTAKVGTPLTTLQNNSDSKFIQVKKETGQTGWVEAKDLQAELPATILLPEIQKQLQEAQTKLTNVTQSMTEQENLIANLQSEKEYLQQTIEELKAKNLELDLLQDTRDERIKMEWMMYGGSVLFFGLLLGFIIPFLPRRKKRQNDW
jgi:SH3 domain protein